MGCACTGWASAWHALSPLCCLLAVQSNGPAALAPSLSQASTECGCAAGTAAVQTAGAELSPAALQELRGAIGSILAADRAAGEAEAEGGAALGAVEDAAPAMAVA